MDLGKLVAMYCKKAVEKLWKSTGTLGAFTFCHIASRRFHLARLARLARRLRPMVGSGGPASQLVGHGSPSAGFA
jgi:hypothetical protein